jgi:membrane associated rhomboid family serine protease
MLMPALTCMFMHGGWAHLLGNMWFLFIFGDNVEARLGRVTFLLFYLFCGLAASAAQYMLEPDSAIPVIGASGAIAGVLGAYAVCWPRARIITLVPIFVLITFVELPAAFVLGFWFVIQLLQGAASIGLTYAHGGVAYGAHAGGFLVGAALMKLLCISGWQARRHGPRTYRARRR